MFKSFVSTGNYQKIHFSYVQRFIHKHSTADNVLYDLPWFTVDVWADQWDRQAGDKRTLRKQQRIGGFRPFKGSAGVLLLVSGSFKSFRTNYEAKSLAVRILTKSRQKGSYGW